MSVHLAIMIHLLSEGQFTFGCANELLDACLSATSQQYNTVFPKQKMHTDIWNCVILGITEYLS